MKHKYKRLLLCTLSAAMLFTISVYADPGDGGPYPVIVENWQTFYPRVTSLRSLNAYLATEQGQKIY